MEALAQDVVSEIQRRFPKVELLEAFRISQVGYWQKIIADKSVADVENEGSGFMNSSHTLADYYGKPRALVTSNVLVPALVDIGTMLDELPQFVSVMERHVSEAHYDQSLTQSQVTQDLWIRLADSAAKKYYSQYLQLATVMLLIPVSCVWAERYFSVMNFVKSARRNALQADHLNATLRMFYSRFDMDTFPFDKAMEVFLGVKDRRGVNAYAAPAKTRTS